MSTRLRCAAACLSAVLLGQDAPAAGSVIGHTEGAPPLTAERVRSTLPLQQQAVWLAYLQRSAAQMQQDRAVLDRERVGLAAVPPLPPSSPSVRSVPLNRETAWYGSAEALHVARVIVSFQTPAGGWGKNMDMTAAERVPGQSFVSNNENRFSAPGDLDQPGDVAWHYVGTLDNDATTTEIRFLALVAQHSAPAEAVPLQRSALRGIRYLLAAQFPNGGWPQVWPLEGGYHDAVTYNDDAVRNAASVLEAVHAGAEPYRFVPEVDVAASGKAVQRAVACVLRSQVAVHGARTAWGQQHDALTLAPVGARNFEPVAVASQESAALILWLEGLPRQTSAMRAAERTGTAWLRAHALYDIAVEGGRGTAEGRHSVPKPGAGPLWARYYDPETGQPVFGDRDKTVRSTMNELSLERRNGYAWYTDAPGALFAGPGSR